LDEQKLDLLLLLPVKEVNHGTAKYEQRQEGRGGETHEVKALFHDLRDLAPRSGRRIDA
jgi:hypothetical protein